MEPNPYESPQSPPSVREKPEWEWATLRDTVARIRVGLSLALGTLLQVITVVPDAIASAVTFSVFAAMAALGLTARNLRLRILAGILVVWYLFQAYAGYQQGLWYQEQLRQLKREIREQSSAPPAPRTTTP